MVQNCLAHAIVLSVKGIRSRPDRTQTRPTREHSAVRQMTHDYMRHDTTTLPLPKCSTVPSSAGTRSATGIGGPSAFSTPSMPCQMARPSTSSSTAMRPQAVQGACLARPPSAFSVHFAPAYRSWLNAPRGLLRQTIEASLKQLPISGALPPGRLDRTRH